MDAQKSKEYQQVFRFQQEVVRLEGRSSRSAVQQALTFRIYTKIPGIERIPGIFSGAPGERTFYKVKDLNPPGSGKG